MPRDFRLDDVVAEFSKAFGDAGLIAPSDIVADGIWHHCEALGGRRGNDAGSYLLHLDGWPTGLLNNFRDGGYTIWHPDGATSRMSDADRAEAKRRIEAAKAERDAERVESQEKVAKDSEWRWSAMVECTEHPYLTRKGVAGHGL